MMIINKIIVLCFISVNLLAQNDLTFKFLFNKEELKNNVYYSYETTDSVNIDKFSFYISHISTSKTTDSTVYLIDALKPEESLSISGDIVGFSVGVDSVTNYEGVKGGDLDPMNGMYWAWQSGYINIKLEGKLNNEKFTFHIGGFQYPFNAFKKVEISSNNISIDLCEVLKQIDLTKTMQVMSPSLEGNRISSIISNQFKSND